MRSPADIIRANAHAEGTVTLAFSLYVTVHKDAAQDAIADSRGLVNDIPQLVADEVLSNLEGLDYIASVTIRQRQL